ncbi:hypothetical protein N7475_006822 [Penicillium sp. IBT 31633x]|nr:hypothetical protein N7475_006822 [Penicillium sp. IBT 31633x]
MPLSLVQFLYSIPHQCLLRQTHGTPRPPHFPWIEMELNSSIGTKEAAHVVRKGQGQIRLANPKCHPLLGQFGMDELGRAESLLRNTVLDFHGFLEL